MYITAFMQVPMDDKSPEEFSLQLLLDDTYSTVYDMLIFKALRECVIYIWSKDANCPSHFFSHIPLYLFTVSRV